MSSKNVTIKEFVDSTALEEEHVDSTVHYEAESFSELKTDVNALEKSDGEKENDKDEEDLPDEVIIEVDPNIMRLRLSMKKLHCVRNLRRFRKVFMDLHKLSKLEITKIEEPDPNHMEKLGKEFDKLTKLMRNTKVIKIFDAISNILFMNPNYESFVYKLTGRELLSIFVFAGYPEFSLEFYRHRITRSTVQGKIYILARRVLYHWMQILFQKNSLVNLDRLFEYLNLFTFYYIIHMNNDRMHKINDLFQRWYYDDKQKDEIEESESLSAKEKIDILENIEKRKASTLKLLKKFYPKFDVEALDEYKKRVDKAKETVYDAFWDKIQKDLEENSSEAFIRVLSDLRMELLSMVPECEKKDKLVTEMNEYFDIEFIKQIIDNKCYNSHSFYALCNYIMSIFEQIQSPARTLVMKKEWDKVVDNVKDKEDLERNKSYMHFLFKELDNLKDSIIAINVLDSMGINVFAL